MMAFLRARQRAITALFPHQGNRQFIIPKRFGLIPTSSVHKDLSIQNVFRSSDVSGTLVTTGFSVFQDSTPVAVASITQSLANDIIVNHASQGIGVKTTVHYDGTGDWVGDNGRPVGVFYSTQVTV